MESSESYWSHIDLTEELVAAETIPDSTEQRYLQQVTPTAAGPKEPLLSSFTDWVAFSYLLFSLSCSFDIYKPLWYGKLVMSFLAFISTPTCLLLGQRKIVYVSVVPKDYHFAWKRQLCSGKIFSGQPWKPDLMLFYPAIASRSTRKIESLLFQYAWGLKVGDNSRLFTGWALQLFSICSADFHSLKRDNEWKRFW